MSDYVAQIESIKILIENTRKDMGMIDAHTHCWDNVSLPPLSSPQLHVRRVLKVSYILYIIN